ncbi:hypothetical protein LL251_02100 [Sphingobium naphthae]|nr:hypothetical protein [Sphingobium naphthae]
MSTEDRISGQNGRKLSKKAREYAAKLAKHGFEGFDTPGRRGRPKSPATLVAQRDGKSARTQRRYVAIMRDLATKLDVSPPDLVGTSLASIGEQQALLKLNPRHATILIIAARRGKKVSAKLRVSRAVARLREKEDPVEREITALVRLWVKSSPEARDGFLERLAQAQARSRKEDGQQA